MSPVNLRDFDSGDYSPGRSYWVRALWLVVEAVFLLNPIVVSYALKAWLLRLFGAQLGRKIVIKPNVHIKYPWRLKVGDHSWLGERSWIDNLADVDIGTNVCISQGAYLCTGNHNWSNSSFRLVAKPISVADGAWIGAFARIGPGVHVGRDSIVTLGAVLFDDAEDNGIYRGNPAVKTGVRVMMSR